jgi:hypothetical protein
MTLADDTTKETVCMLSASRAKAQTKAMAKEIVLNADLLDTTKGNAPTSRRSKARARDSQENATTAATKGNPHGSARKARKEESHKARETVTKGRVKDAVGEGACGRSTEKNLKQIGDGSRMRTSHGASIQLERGK